MAETRRGVESTIATFQRLGDDEGVAHASFELGRLLIWSGRCSAGMDALEGALQGARRRDDRRLARSVSTWIILAATFGPLPVDDAIRQIDRVRADEDASGQVHAEALVTAGFLRALQGRFDEARSLAAEGRSLLRELGLDLDWAGIALLSGSIELLADEPRAAEAEFRSAYDTLRQRGETAYLSTIAACLAEAMRWQQRFDEALRLVEESKALSAPDDLTTQSIWRMVHARVLAAQDACDEAERLARESVALLEPTDSLHDRAEALLCLAEVLSLAGRPDEAIGALDQAIELAALKGDLVTGRRAQAARDRGSNMPDSVV